MRHAKPRAPHRLLAQGKFCVGSHRVGSRKQGRYPLLHLEGTCLPRDDSGYNSGLKQEYLVLDNSKMMCVEAMGVDVGTHAFPVRMNASGFFYMLDLMHRPADVKMGRTVVGHDWPQGVLSSSPPRPMAASVEGSDSTWASKSTWGQLLALSFERVKSTSGASSSSGGGVRIVLRDAVSFGTADLESSSVDIARRLVAEDICTKQAGIRAAAAALDKDAVSSIQEAAAAAAMQRCWIRRDSQWNNQNAAGGNGQQPQSLEKRCWLAADLETAERWLDGTTNEWNQSTSSGGSSWSSAANAVIAVTNTTTPATPAAPALTLPLELDGTSSLGALQLFRNHELQGVLLQVHSGVLRRHMSTVTAATSSTPTESPADRGPRFAVTKTAGQVQAVGRELLVWLGGSSFSKYGSGKTWPNPNYKRRDNFASFSKGSGKICGRFHRIEWFPQDQLLPPQGQRPLRLLPWLEYLLLLLDSPPRLVLVLPPH
ncbi:hypothetical protein SELMODRAFT_424337 [Selaginella moellendorffii]|uniref:Uncharacterized protein n=1 Tax=Selaginella moellendorffii TaxID=88036 RepID=D8SPK0_SELML|nr:hypothetical protein SELMODRAFT_424337 [Selaginella moellendorffii]